MTDTEARLLRAVLESPGDDTPRLAYADWLDEIATTVKVCSGSHRHNGGIGYNHGTWHNTDPRKPHHHCDDKCLVSDGNAERAEFIRVQCEWFRLMSWRVPHNGGTSTGGDVTELRNLPC